MSIAEAAKSVGNIHIFQTVECAAHVLLVQRMRLEKGIFMGRKMKSEEGDNLICQDKSH